MPRRTEKFRLVGFYQGGASDPFAISSDVAAVQHLLAQVCNDPNATLVTSFTFGFPKPKAVEWGSDPFNVPIPGDNRRRR